MAWEFPDRCLNLEPPDDITPEWYEEYMAVFPIKEGKYIFTKDDAISSLRNIIEDIEGRIAIIEDCDSRKEKLWKSYYMRG